MEKTGRSASFDPPNWASRDNTGTWKEMSLYVLEMMNHSVLGQPLPVWACIGRVEIMPKPIRALSPPFKKCLSREGDHRWQWKGLEGSRNILHTKKERLDSTIGGACIFLAPPPDSWIRSGPAGRRRGLFVCLDFMMLSFLLQLTAAADLPLAIMLGCRGSKKES